MRIIPEDRTDGESAAAGEEESAATLVSVAIPAERCRIQELLAMLPTKDEIARLRNSFAALGALWAVHPDEKIVIFTTYLGSVDTLGSGDRDTLSRQRR